jgi:hypothetical protein
MTCGWKTPTPQQNIPNFLTAETRVSSKAFVIFDLFAERVAVDGENFKEL